MNAALGVERRGGLPATELEPQSQQVPGSHGTHVTSIAAGNRGVCRRAAIAAVLISLPESDLDKRLSFYDSSRLVDAVDYLLDVARELGRPISINISLGTNGHSHDGSAAVTRWIDAQLADRRPRGHRRRRQLRPGARRDRRRLRLDDGAHPLERPDRRRRPRAAARMGRRRQHRHGRVGKRDGDLVRRPGSHRRVGAAARRRLDRPGRAASVHPEPHARATDRC